MLFPNAPYYVRLCFSIFSSIFRLCSSTFSEHLIIYNTLHNYKNQCLLHLRPSFSRHACFEEEFSSRNFLVWEVLDASCRSYVYSLRRSSGLLEWRIYTNTLVDHSLCLVLYAYSMTAAVGHFSLSSSDTTALDWNNHDH